MSIKELIELLKGRGFYCYSNGQIRRGDSCPITAACYLTTRKWFQPAHWKTAVNLIHLRNPQLIVKAADGKVTDKKTEALRKVLLRELCQLKN